MIINISLEIVFEDFRVEILRTTEHPNSGLIDRHRLIQRHPLNFVILNSCQSASIVFLKICHGNSEFLFVQRSLQNDILLVVLRLLSLQKTIFMELGLNPFSKLFHIKMRSLCVCNFLRHFWLFSFFDPQMKTKNFDNHFLENFRSKFKFKFKIVN